MMILIAASWFFLSDWAGCSEGLGRCLERGREIYILVISRLGMVWCLCLRVVIFDNTFYLNLTLIAILLTD